MNKGIVSAFAAYILWGIFPIYFKIIQVVPSPQILAHRIAWSFLLLLVVMLVRREIKNWIKVVTRRTLIIYTIAAVLLGCNWLTYVWSVNAGYVVEASLGYFINPLVSVLLGVIFLREKLRPMQWIPVGLAAAGVLYLTLTYGSLPWISLTLAFSFGIYGLMKKISPLDSFYGLSLETAILFLPATGYLIFCETQGVGSFGHEGLLITVLLALTGVISVIPLILFSIGVRSAPLSTIGLIQYITPTLQFLIGVLVYHETFSGERLIGFAIIWLALIIFTVENLSAVRHSKNAAGLHVHGG
ncbi:MAG: EamA family transporter RarD [Anaerolineae bacterium]|nr:EamA family transporter RarD [Anaerolineae bacterium]